MDVNISCGCIKSWYFYLVRMIFVIKFKCNDVGVKVFDFVYFL